MLDVFHNHPNHVFCASFQIASDRSDRRLNFPRQNSEITKYMDAAWRLKEQTQNLWWQFMLYAPNAI